MVEEKQPVMVHMTLAEFKKRENWLRIAEFKNACSPWVVVTRDSHTYKIIMVETNPNIDNDIQEHYVKALKGERLGRENAMNNWKASNDRLKSIHKRSIKKHKIFSAVCFIGAILIGIGIIILW